MIIRFNRHGKYCHKYPEGKNAPKNVMRLGKGASYAQVYSLAADGSKDVIVKGRCSNCVLAWEFALRPN